jgi:cytoskeletal protein CcmA (bactofilin family)
VKGDLSGDEDLTIEGRIEGRIHLPDHQLTIGASARIHAELIAKSVVVIGEVGGNINASERVEIHDTGIVNGDVRAPRLLIHEGALINGTIDMSDPNVAPGSQPGLPQSGLLKTQPSDDEPSD